MSESEKRLRWSIFRALLPNYGKLVTPESLQNTPLFIPSIKKIHPLITGSVKSVYSAVGNTGTSECFIEKEKDFNFSQGYEKEYCF